MICYKDQGWCSSSDSCKNVECFRNYTPEEHQRNINGVNLPISEGDFKTEECGYELRLQPGDGERST